MHVDGKTLTIKKSLWVQHGGVDVEERGAELVLTGRDDESYLKVLNHFGRVLKLFTFEGGCWIDADTGLAAKPFDETQAGQLPGSAATGPAAAAMPAATTQRRSTRPPASKPRTKAAPKAGKAPAKAGAKSRGKPARRRTG